MQSVNNNPPKTPFRPLVGESVTIETRNEVFSLQSAVRRLPWRQRRLFVNCLFKNRIHSAVTINMLQGHLSTPSSLQTNTHKQTNNQSNKSTNKISFDHLSIYLFGWLVGCLVVCLNVVVVLCELFTSDLLFLMILQVINIIMIHLWSTFVSLFIILDPCYFY